MSESIVRWFRRVEWDCVRDFAVLGAAMVVFGVLLVVAITS